MTEWPVLHPIPHYSVQVELAPGYAECPKGHTGLWYEQPEPCLRCLMDEKDAILMAAGRPPKGED